MSVLGVVQPVDFTATKDVFLDAVRFATSIGGSCPPFGDELKTSAREQVVYMLREDESTPLVTADAEVKSVVKSGLSHIFSSFEMKLSSLQVEAAQDAAQAELDILQSLADIEWICNILPDMHLMKEFVSSWTGISNNVLAVVENERLNSLTWGLKMKLIELTGRALEAVGYGKVILPSPCRLQLLRIWLPFIRRMKPLSDSKGSEELYSANKMNEDQWQDIEGAIVSLVLTLPSNDQGLIFKDWMEAQPVQYPDLSEAFEIWCYRSKSAKRRLMKASE